MNEMKNLACELSEIVGTTIGTTHIHVSKDGRNYYIQAPVEGAPMLLHHYRGPFFVDMHPADYKKLEAGEVSAHDYIISANWQIGYYWGGGSMVGGGYYQPFDIVNKQADVQRYFKILACRGGKLASLYDPSEESCNNCSVENCPFSNYKSGNWSNELQEEDPRCFLFQALLKRFENNFDGYTLKGFLCTSIIADDEILLVPNARYSEKEERSFIAYASESIIRALLMHTIVPEDWDTYAASFTFKMKKECWGSNEIFDVTLENVKEAIDMNDRTLKTAPEEVEEIYVEVDAPAGIVGKIVSFIKNIF